MKQLLAIFHPDKTDNTWTYKPPGINDIPENFTVELLDFEHDRVNNGFGAVFPCLRRVLKCCGPLKNPTMGAKRYRSNRAMGEPPMMTVTAVGSALRGTGCCVGKSEDRRPRATPAAPRARGGSSTNAPPLSHCFHGVRTTISRSRGRGNVIVVIAAAFHGTP